MHKNASENIVCEMAAIFSRGRWVNPGHIYSRQLQVPQEHVIHHVSHTSQGLEKAPYETEIQEPGTSWWLYGMEILSALLALCEENLQ